MILGRFPCKNRVFVTTTTFIFPKGKKVLDDWTFAQFCNTYLISCYIIRFTAVIKKYIKKKSYPGAQAKKLILFQTKQKYFSEKKSLSKKYIISKKS
jgi:hypothetical protein